MTFHMERRLLYIPVLHINTNLNTNLINARQKLPAVNQLEKWFKDEVILINVSATAHGEAQADGEVALDLIQFLFKGKLFRGWLGGSGGRQLLAAFAAEFKSRRIGKIALRANHCQLDSALTAELHAFRIIELTVGASHLR